MDLRRLIALARAWLPLGLLCAVLAGAGGYVVSNLQHPVYEARSTLIVGQALSAANPDYTQLLVAQNLSATYSAIAKTGPNLEAVSAELGGQVSPAALRDAVSVDAPRDSTFLYITAQDTIPERAAAIANALAQRLIDVSPTIQGREADFQKSIDEDLTATQELIDRTQARLDTLSAINSPTPEQTTEIQALEGRLANLRSTYATLLSFSSGSATNLLTVVEPAAVPTTPVSPRILLNTVLAATVGLLVVLAVAFVAHQLDDRVRDADTVHEITGLSTLGTVARNTTSRGVKEFYQLAGLLYPRSPHAEAYRTLRTNVEFASVDAPVRTLLVTSSLPGEGKTVTASNLAVVFAQSGRKVILVDADLRQPGVHAMFNLQNTRGLTDLLRDDSMGVAVVTNATEQDNLRVVTAGPVPPNPAELLGSMRMQTVVQRLQRAADIVIFDSPPLLPVTDAAVLSSFLGGTILVIDASRARRRTVRLARESLTRAGAKTLGVVLNRVSAGSPFAYGQAYGYPEGDQGPAPADVVAERSGSANAPNGN